MAENSEVRSLIESILKSSGPTGKGDIVSAFSAMQNSMIIQIDLSRRILKTLEESLAFNKEAESDRRRDDLLRDRVKPDTPRGAPEPKPNGGSGSSGSGSITDLLTSSFRNVFAALTAFQLASAGLRGWETRAIGALQNGLSSLSDLITNGARNLRDVILVRYFGFTPDGAIGRDAQGRFMRLPPIADQIATRVENLRIRALRVFGLGADGLPIMLRGADGRFTGYSIVGRVTARISELLQPLRNAASGISSFISGAGSAIFNSSLFSSIGSFASTVGRILRPLGFLISAYDGVTAFLDTEGTLYERFTAGISAFIGDFVGAPLDLLRDIVAWGIEQLGFDEGAEWLRSFSFESLITSMVSGIFSFVSRAVTYVRDLFTFSEDEDGGMLSTLGSIGGVLYSGFLSAVSFITDLFSFGGEDRTLLGTLGNLTDIVFAPVNLAINFVRGIFGFNEDEQEEPFRLSTFINETIGIAVDWVRDRVSGIGIALRERFEEFSEYVQSIPERIRFAAESMWIDLSERMTIGFMEFGEWLGSLPSRLLVMAYDVIRSVPGGSMLVSNSRYNEAVAALQDRGGISASIAAVRASAETRRIELAARESAAERLREARLQYMAQSAAQAQGGGGMGGSVVSNSGNVTTDARTNATYNYYTSQDPSRAIDPSLAPGAS